MILLDTFFEIIVIKPNNRKMIGDVSEISIFFHVHLQKKTICN